MKNMAVVTIITICRVHISFLVIFAFHNAFPGTTDLNEPSLQPRTTLHTVEMVAEELAENWDRNIYIFNIFYIYIYLAWLAVLFHEGLKNDVTHFYRECTT